jgi:hypothetical protein
MSGKYSENLKQMHPWWWVFIMLTEISVGTSTAVTVGLDDGSIVVVVAVRSINLNLCYPDPENYPDWNHCAPQKVIPNTE